MYLTRTTVPSFLLRKTTDTNSFKHPESIVFETQKHTSVCVEKSWVQLGVFAAFVFLQIVTPSDHFLINHQNRVLESVQK